VHDLEAQSLVFGDAVEGAAISPGDRLCRREDKLEQAINVALGRKRRADEVQLLEALAESSRRPPRLRSRRFGVVS
jgi:hypothetical protein